MTPATSPRSRDHNRTSTLGAGVLAVVLAAAMLAAAGCGTAAEMAPEPASPASAGARQAASEPAATEQAAAAEPEGEAAGAASTATARREPRQPQPPTEAAPAEPASEAPETSEAVAATAAAVEAGATAEELDLPEGVRSINVAGFGVHIPQRRDAIEPPDGTWLLDETSGRRYYLKELSKDEQWSWATPEHTHIRHGRVGLYEVESENDHAFVVRVYHPQDGTGWKLRHPPTEEQIAAAAATFEAEVGESDRLRFGALDSGLPSRGQWRNGFDVGDMNGDGHLDIVHGPARKGGPGTPVILLGDGAGGWRVWQEARYPVLRYSYGDARVADFDGDGHLDLALGQHLQGVRVMLGDGNGNFRLASSGLPWDLPGAGGDAGGFSTRAMAVADWNADGRPDLLAVGEGPRPARESGKGTRGLLPSKSFGVAVFLNELDENGGAWHRLDQGLEFGEVFGDALGVGDFDGDGRLDFVTSSNLFGHRNLVAFGEPGGGWRYAEVEALRPRSYTKAVAVGDFDGDGHDDLAVSQVSNQADRWWSALDVLYYRPDGWQRRVLASEEERIGFATALGAGDVDGDGHLDLAAVTENGATWIFLGDGQGSFTRESSPEIPPVEGGCTGYHVMVSDVDGDGRGEVIEAYAGEPSAIFDPGRCPTLGAIRAWDPQPAEETVASTP